MSKRAEEAAKEIYKDGIQLVGRRDRNNNIVIYPETMVGVLRNAAQRGYELAEKDLGWHSVEESLPEIDEEVIVLIDALNFHMFYRLAFGHIVNEGETVDIDGKPYKPESHKGWNIPGVKFWMPMPKIPKNK